MKIKRALISVSNKSGLEKLVKTLHKNDIEIISSSGTAKFIKDAGLPVIEIEDVASFPEILGGRVKTLQPQIHGGILAKRDNPDHEKDLKEHAIQPIDLVVVNLYPFEEVIRNPKTTRDHAIENIDIGGVALLRAAAKNYEHVAVLSSPDQYEMIEKEIESSQTLKDETRLYLSRQAFLHTARYDQAITDYLSNLDCIEALYPASLSINLTKIQDLRYGENPHQKAAFYQVAGKPNTDIAKARILHGKELSFNNIMDLASALEIIREFDNPSACIIKHTSPCGVAEAAEIKTAFLNAHASDPLSAFGGIVGVSESVDGDLAKTIIDSGFLECIIAPSFDDKALEVLTVKKNLRLLELPELKEKKESADNFEIKNVSGGYLLQDKDNQLYLEKNLKIVTKIKPTEKDLSSLLFAWRVVKHVKSNAIVLANNHQTVGIGAGHTSRVDAVITACRKAGDRTKGAYLSSDAFFPKPDNIIEAAEAGIKAIIQPGGSIGDKKVIEAADKANIAMVFTGERHFKH